MDISVIMCTWNNARRLAVTLGAMAGCEVPDTVKWELVLVNNNCTDDTDKVVAEHAEALPINYVKEPRQGLSKARNAGLQAASGKLIIFTDDDIKPCREWLTLYWGAFQEKPKVFFFGGPVESEFEGGKPDEELLNIAPGSVRGWSSGDEPKDLDSNDFFLSANWACPRDRLEIVGGFNVNKGINASSTKIRVGEETDVMRRLRKLGMKGWYIPKATVIHMVPEHKCNIKHIGDRNEAYGIEIAKERYKSPIESSAMRRVPYWMYKRAFGAWARWIGRKLLRRKGYREYLKWRLMKGTIFGVSEEIGKGKK